MAKVDILEERINNHIRFFWALMTVGFGWLAFNSVQLMGIKETVGKLIPEKTITENLSSAISTSPDKAKKPLIQVVSSIHQFQAAKVSLPDKTIEEATEELNKLSNVHQDLPETWSAIGAFITYRSQIIRGWEETNLPLCDNQFHGATASTEKGSNVVTHGPVEVHDCKIILDSPGFTANLSVDLELADVIFTHCAVFYNGGPIIFVPVKVARDTPPKFVGQMIFKECLFVVSLPGVPDSHGMEFARALLSSHSGTVELKPS